MSSEARNQQHADSKYAGFLLGLLFASGDGSNMFLKNVDGFLPYYTTLHLRRQHPLFLRMFMKFNSDFM
jgi:hypothetical protein